MKNARLYIAIGVLGAIVSGIIGLKIGVELSRVVLPTKAEKNFPWDLRDVAAKFPDPCQSAKVLKSGKKSFQIDELEEEKVIRVLSYDSSGRLVETVLDINHRQYFDALHSCE